MPDRFVANVIERPAFGARLAPPPVIHGAFGAHPLACAGSLEVFIARSETELRACQELRYVVFYEEMSARPSPEIAAERRDFDRHDDVCDHLFVVDRSPLAGPRVVGTYRLLLQERALRAGGFYTAGEFDLSPLFSPAHAGLNFLELGRSCVHSEYRVKPVIDLLWRGIGNYLMQHSVDVMFGCGSFPGRNPDEHAEALSYLARYHLAPEAWRGRALPHRYQAMDRMPGIPIEPRRGFRGLPPVIRGYVRAGAYVGDGALIDHDFGTVDVLIVFPVSQMNERYFARFVQPDEV